MRALYLPEFDEATPVVEEDSKLHHLTNVLRISKGEELLVLNGKGKKFVCRIDAISKKQIQLEVISSRHDEKKFKLSVAIGLTKKDALDLNIKQAIELGVSELIIFKSDYSQSYPINEQRIDRLVESAMEQSNEAYYPQLTWVDRIQQVPLDLYPNRFAFISEVENSKAIAATLEGSSLVIIGPEGGFSPDEIQYLQENTTGIHLPTNILRSTTALPTAVGFILGKYI